MSSLLYIREVWHFTKTQYKLLKAFQRSCLRKILGVKSFAGFPKAALHALTGLARVLTLVLQRKLRFVFRIDAGLAGPVAHEMLETLSDTTQACHTNSCSL